MSEILFEETGIIVWAKDDKLIIADDDNRVEYEDTPENREKLVIEAKKLVKTWETEKEISDDYHNQK